MVSSSFFECLVMSTTRNLDSLTDNAIKLRLFYSSSAIESVAIILKAPTILENENGGMTELLAWMLTTVIKRMQVG